MKPRRKRWQKPLDERTKAILEMGHRTWRNVLNHDSMLKSIAAGNYKQPCQLTRTPPLCDSTFQFTTSPRNLVAAGQPASVGGGS